MSSVSESSSAVQHTAARRRLAKRAPKRRRRLKFQHTAARRRLVHVFAAGRFATDGFNTQPPEGGWYAGKAIAAKIPMFQHTAARRRLD